MLGFRMDRVFLDVFPSGLFGAAWSSFKKLRSTTKASVSGRSGKGLRFWSKLCFSSFPHQRTFYQALEVTRLQENPFRKKMKPLTFTLLYLVPSIRNTCLGFQVAGPRDPNRSDPPELGTETVRAGGLTMLSNSSRQKCRSMRRTEEVLHDNIKCVIYVIILECFKASQNLPVK